MRKTARISHAKMTQSSATCGKPRFRFPNSALFDARTLQWLVQVWRGLPALLALATLSGCAAIEEVRPDISSKPLPSRLDEIALINELRSAYVVTNSDRPFPEDFCFKGKNLKAFKSKSGQGYQVAEDPENIGDGCIRFRQVTEDTSGKIALQSYLSAGFGLTDIYCERFFTVAAAAERNRKFGRTVSNGVDTLVGGILTLSGAGNTAIGITNAGFGLIDNGFEAYDTAYLVGPDLSEVRRLVAAAQGEYRQNVLAKDAKGYPTNYAGARSVIERYAGLCSYTGMRELVGKSVKDKTDNINKTVQDKNEAGDAAEGTAKGGGKKNPSATVKPATVEASPPAPTVQPPFAS